MLVLVSSVKAVLDPIPLLASVLASVLAPVLVPAEGVAEAPHAGPRTARPVQRVLFPQVVADGAAQREEAAFGRENQPVIALPAVGPPVVAGRLSAGGPGRQ